MKRILIAGVIAIVFVGGLSVYSLHVLGKAAQRAADLKEAYQASVRALLETNDLFPYTPSRQLDPVRFPTWLAVRSEVASEVAARVAEPSSNDFHTRETVNDLLIFLRGKLVEHEMSAAEYAGTATRWRELLALPEFEELRKSWRTHTATRKRPDGIALPEPAKDAQEKELEQLRRYETNLRDSMDADLMDPLLEEVAKG